MSQPPNILLVMADQLMPFLMGAYGHPVVQTPHLDRLVERGVRFDAAYTPYPLCAPARAALMTGRYGSDLGCYDNAAVLHADVPTVAHYLTNAGYEAVLTGKMHFIGPDQLHGFRRRLTTDVFPAGVGWVPSLDAQGKFGGGGHARLYVAPNVGVRPWTKFLSYDEETHFRALEYIRERGRSAPTEPFFLISSYHHPHDPFHVTQELWDLYEGADIEIPVYPEHLEQTYSAMDRWINEHHETDKVDLGNPESLYQLRRSYYGLVTYIDRKVGELLTALEQTGQRDNTVVIFTSDHGDMLAERKMVQKRCFYEWSARVPLIASFPGGAYAGKTVAAPVSLIDLLPTLLDVAGVPTEQRLPVDGTSLIGVMEGSDVDAAERPLLSEYHLEKVYASCFMVRRGRYKYIYIHRHGSQLFDLEADPGEWHNLAGQPEMQELEAELHGLILARFDPDRIEADGADSIARREVIKAAMERNGTHWDYSPYFDATKQYVR
ncbi:MAG: choline-sulfatase [Chloroflexota bacterium]|nr:choline-sulfatase [Chloroflexota bacterium]MDQ5864700.1 choline-sulfatase [Chloroflexota bacterium]